MGKAPLRARAPMANMGAMPVEFQTGYHNCGPASLSNALAALGYDVPVDAVAQLAGLDGDGCDARQLRRAATALGSLDLESCPRGQGVAWLQGHLTMGHPVVLLFDRGEHWVAAIGTLGPKTVVFDPASRVRPSISVLDKDQLLAAWRSKAGPRYALALWRQP